MMMQATEDVTPDWLRELNERVGSKTTVKHDIENSRDLRFMVEAFYLEVLKDELLAPFFFNKLYIFQRLPILTAYWEKILWGTGWYRRNTMQIHRELGREVPFKPEHFERWLVHFNGAVDAHFVGEQADKIKFAADRVAGHMQARMCKSPIMPN